MTGSAKIGPRKKGYAKGRRLALAWGSITKADEDRFMVKVAKLDSGCWRWTSGIQYNGYGQFWWGGTTRLAHRVSYVIHGGYIRPGMTLDHLCGNKWCVNPEHLEQVTSKENTFRSPIAPARINSLKTHCKRGHPFSGVNLRILANGDRQCCACSRMHTLNWWRRNHAN